MKTLIYLFTALILTIPVHGQYNPQLIDSTKHWSIACQP